MNTSDTANDTAVKRDYSAMQRIAAAEEGQALPDGSFPIRNGADLSNALRAYGRAKDKEAAKAHIMKRARDLGFETMIPDSWKDSSTDTAEKAPFSMGSAMSSAASAAGSAGSWPGIGRRLGSIEMESQKMRMAARRRRMASMGMKSDEITDDVFLCAMERKINPAGAAPCTDCTGGCLGGADFPDLLEIEAMAEDTYGKVLNSGYSDLTDMFALEVQRKDGRIIDAFYSGDGEAQGWRLRPAQDDQMSAIPADEAIRRALGVVEGKALSISVATLDDKEVFSVEVDGKDGLSYDVFVTPEGDVLGYDQYEYKDDDADIEVKADEDMSDDESKFLADLMEFEAIATEAEARSAGLL